jgi:glyoxylase-like metal-dependent hydrolase (beta-lactamase superfamily II)
MLKCAPTMTTNTWQIYAIRYAKHMRTTRENMMGGDPHDVSPMPMDYFVWALMSGDRTIVVDTGFEESMAKKRGREYLNNPAEGLKTLGINPAKVEDVIITHMHYDHCGNHNLLPAARYHLQDREMIYCTGRSMTHPFAKFPFEEDDVVAMIRRLYGGRVVFHDGDEEIAPGISVHHVGGHTMGMQVVRVNTRRGFVVLASDSSHYYANIERSLPYPLAYNLTEVLEGYRKVYSLASSREHVIPGHDPLVLERYPAARPELEGWVVRLD